MSKTIRENIAGKKYAWGNTTSQRYLYLSLRAVVISDRNLVADKRDARGQKGPKSSHPQGPAPSKGSREESSLAPSASGSPGLPSLLPPLRGLAVCASSLCASYRTVVTGRGPILIMQDGHISRITTAEILFPPKVTVSGQGIALGHIFGGPPVNPL